MGEGGVGGGRRDKREGSEVGRASNVILLARPAINYNATILSLESKDKKHSDTLAPGFLRTALSTPPPPGR